MNTRVLAVVVCYNPNISALERSLNALIEQDCDLLVVDNASTNQTAVAVLTGSLQRTELQAQERNVGLGAAHNLGIRAARLGRYDYVLLMDQDSMPLNQMVANLLNAHQAKSRHNAVSAVGATYLNADNGAESFFVRFGWLKFQRHYCGSRDDDGCIEADFLISSGSLFALSSFDHIGEMDEGLFIDHVDTDWFLRAKHQGFNAFGVCDAVMQHGLGETTHQITVGRRQRNVPQHKSFRYYYIFRNSILLYKRSYSDGRWKWNDLQRLSMIAILFGLLKAPRGANLTMIWRGIRDGVRGITGPLKS